MKLRILTDPDGVAWLAADDVINLLHHAADHAADVRMALRRDADTIFDLTDTDQPAQPKETAA